MGILVIKGQNRRTIYALKSPNMGSESCTVLRLRVMCKLVMCCMWMQLKFKPLVFNCYKNG